MLSGIPVVFAYAPCIILTSVGGKPSVIAAAGLLVGSLCVTHALRDPEMRLDTVLARYLFAGALATILVFLALSIGATLVLYSVEQAPATDNFLWRWVSEWSQLGYPREEFHVRQRDALVGFTLSASGFMIVVVGGSMLGAILRWTCTLPLAEQQAPTGRRNDDCPRWVASVVERLRLGSPMTADEATYVAVLDGHKVDLTASHYERLVSDQDDLSHDLEFLVNKVSGYASLRIDGRWTGNQPGGRKSGPFSLLGIYARNPGRRFTNADPRVMLAQELGRSPDSISVGDFMRQLQRRKPPLPVERDETGSYIPGHIRTCLLELKSGPDSNGPSNNINAA